MGLTLVAMERLPISTWYALLERWFVDAYVTALASRAAVLEWITEKWPQEYETRWPNAQRHGRSRLAQQAAQVAEDRYRAAPRT